MRPFLCFNGGAKEDRTPDLLNAIQALSQLSYNPNTFKITTPFKRFLLPLVASVTRLQIFRYTSLSLVCLKATFAARHKNVHRTFLFSCAQLSYNPNTFKITTPFKRFLLPLVASVTRLQIFRYTSLSLVCLKATFAARHKNVHRTFLFSCAQLSYNPIVTISLQQKYS